MEKMTITEDFNDSYKELKAEIKEKYTKQLHQAVLNMQTFATAKISNLLSEEVLQLIDQTEKLKKAKKSEKQEFFKSNKYLATQSKIKRLKRELEKGNDTTNEENEKELNKCIAEITTLNITIKNRQKSIDEEIKTNTDIILKELKEHSNELDKLKSEIMDYLNEKIIACLTGYNTEILELNKTFGVENYNPNEMPFDGNIVKLEIPVFKFAKNESIKSVDVSGEEKTLIYGENNSSIIN